MKILIVSHEYPPIGGGGANACKFLSREFVKRGHSVVVVTAGFESLNGIAEEDGYAVHRLPCKRKHREHCSFAEMSDYINRAMPYCAQLQNLAHFDVCMVFFGIPGGVVGRYLKSRFSLPYIIRFGGGDIPGFQERFKLIYKFVSPFVKNIWHHASALVANSEGLKKFALDFCPKYPVQVVPNGVDTDFFSPEGSTVSDEGDEVRLLFVSRLIKRKGLQNLIPHLKDIEKACGRRVTLTVVGDGPYRESLENLCTFHDVEDRVSFEGQKDKEEIPPYFSKADIFVFPSSREGMPNAVLEAMAGGLPVVMTPCEGAAELIDGNGIIAEGEFYKSVIEAVKSGRLADMGRRSAKRARKEFSWGQTAEKYLEIMKL